MSIRLSHSLNVQEELDVSLNPGAPGHLPFAVVELDEDSRSYMTAATPADCDEMIRAWARAKELLLLGAAGTDAS